MLSKSWIGMSATLIASVAGGAVLTAHTLRALGRQQLARRVLLLGGPAGTLFLIAAALLPMRWDRIALLVVAVNVVAGVIFQYLLRGKVDLEPRSSRPPLGRLVWYAAGHGLVTAYVGAGIGVLCLLAGDRVVSTLFPSLASRADIIGRAVMLFLTFGFLGAIVGAGEQWRTPDGSMRRRAAAVIGTVIGYFMVRACAAVLIEIPAFQGHALRGTATTPGEIAATLAPWIQLVVLTYIAAIAAGWLLANVAAETWRVRGRVAAVVGGASLASVACLVVQSGSQSYGVLLIGQQLERRGAFELAERAYGVGLAQHTDGAISAHLQYRLALLHRTRGATAAARDAFAKVVTTHTAHSRLTARAERFVAALDRAPAEARRMTVRGVTTRTEFKAAYCVPNSLSLVLQHWGVPASAKTIGRDITAVDLGTTVSAVAWYVQSRGLDHWIMPLAGIDDLRSLLDQQIPLLVYVPQHVIAVVGYDDALRSLVTYDVAEEDVWVDRPIDELLPEWKSEFALIGIVLPPERFAALPREQQERLERWTRAFVHHDLHERYHHSPDAEDQDRALAHLQQSIKASPDLFFDLAHVIVRPRWTAQRDPDLFAPTQLGTTAGRGLAFARYDFGNDEALRELALLNLELGRDAELRAFLEGRYKDGTLADHPDLIGLLGLLEYQRQHFDSAVSYLALQKDEGRFSLVLARALERTGGAQAALNEYRLFVEAAAAGSFSDDDDDDEDDRTRSMLYFMKARAMVPRLAAAMPKIVELAGEVGDQEWVRSSAGTYLRAFPWDAEMQVLYAESIATKLAREPDLPDDSRNTLGRELKRSLGILRSLDSTGAFANRIREMEAGAPARATSPSSIDARESDA